MQARGVLDSRAMLELAGAGVQVSSVYERLGGTLGKSQAEIKKMAETGKISAAQAISAIQQELLGKLGETAFGEKAAEDARSHIDGIKNVIKAKLEELQLSIGEKVAPAIVTALGAASTAMTDFLKSADGQATMAALSATLVFIVTTAAKLVSHVGDVVAVLRQAWDVAKTLAPVLAVVAGIFAAWGIGLAVSMIPSLLALGVMLVTVVLPGLIATAAAALVAAAPFIAIGAAVLGLIYVFTHWGEVMAWIGTNVVDGMIGGIENGIGKAVQAAKHLGQSVMNAVKSTLGIASPSVEMAKLGGFAAEGFGQGLDDGTQKHVATAADGLSVATLSGAGSSSGGGSAGGNVVHLTVEVQAPAGGSRQDAEQFAEVIAPAVRREVYSALQDMAIAAGVG
jgi:hypothetical protein